MRFFTPARSLRDVSALDLARWQFAITTLYHFLFVPVTIGLVWFVAAFQTAWHRTHDERWLRLTRFFGKLFLINFALGVVTGIVQEFQFGMNWSAYSKYVGDIFGAPLAMEGLAAFFLESTFLGLWIFGWDRLKPKVHLATIWIVAIGTTASAYFILAANSWMQHPVGYKLNPVTHRAEMTSIAQILTNSTLIRAFGHTIAAAALTGSMLVLGVAAWHLRKRPGDALFGVVARIALWARPSRSSRSRSRTGSRSSPTTPGTRRCRGSTTSRPPTSRSTAPATTGRSSASTTGASAS